MHAPPEKVAHLLAKVPSLFVERLDDAAVVLEFLAHLLQRKGHKETPAVSVGCSDKSNS